jgi:hypothetical protein
LTSSPNYCTIITNELGDRYYLSITHYYIKIDYITFKRTYDFDPIKDFFKLGKLEELSGESNIQPSQQQSEMDMCFTFVDNDYIYLPFAACMISKYPFVKQMEKCLDAILKLTVDSNFSLDELNRFVRHLIYEVPIPPVNKRLMFYIPYLTTPVEIHNLPPTELPLFSNDLYSLFNYFSFENIMIIHMLMLFEQRVIFVHNDYKVLSEVSQTFTSLIFPLTWIHTYIPILTEESLMVVLTFLPYIIGIEESMLSSVNKLLECNKEQDENNIFFVNIKKNVIELYSNGQTKKIKKRSLYQYVPEYPETIYNELVKGLREIKKSDNLKTPGKANKMVISLFVKAMVYLFGDYKKYVSIIDSIPLLNTTSFLSKRPPTMHEFYKELTGGQIFRYFLQNKQTSPYFEKMCIRYSCLAFPHGRERSNSLNRMTFGNHKTTPIKKTNIFTPVTSAKKVVANTSSFSVCSKEIENKSHEMIDTYIITQFFTQDPVIRLEPAKLEEYLTLKYKRKDNFNLLDLSKETLDYFEKRIYNNQKDLDFRSTGLKRFNRYLIDGIHKRCQSGQIQSTDRSSTSRGSEKTKKMYSYI